MTSSESSSNKPSRVVSLLGASTETIYRLGLGSVLVGRSHECDYPPECLSLPCISRPRLDVDNSTSKDIDDVVRHHSALGEAIYKLDSDVIAKLRPDLIIAQDHCRVCAITPEDMQSSEACLNIPQLIVRPSTLEDCLANVETVARGLGYPQRGKLLRQTLEYQMDRVSQVVAATVSSRSLGKRPKVALLEWCDPVMGCGYWLPELVRVAGGEAMHCPPPGGATPNISFSTLLDSKPDCIIFALCGFGLTRAARELVQSWGHEKLQLVQQSVQRVYVVDGNYLINRSGPRVVESAEALAEAIHPELQGHFGHYGTEFLTTLEGAMALVDAGTETGSTKSRPRPFPPKISREDGDESIIGPTAPANAADETVARQLEHLRRDEYLSAFALNSSANQARWCSPDRFVSILQSHPSFRRLLTEPASVGEVQQSSSQSSIATVQVTLPKTEDQSMVVLVWTMVAEPSGEVVSWRTEKVGIFSQ